MYFIDSMIRNVINIPGWSTSRKIIVFESDDWGSIRMPSKAKRDNLIGSGFDFSNQPFNMFDSLESNDDLSALFEVLVRYRDRSGRYPVFTAVNIVANPVFEKIRNDNYINYYYEPFTETLKRYNDSDKVIELYKEGIRERLFIPVFHGREHLNVQRWLRALQSGNKAVLETFKHELTAVHLGPGNEFLGDFQAAFDVDFPGDVIYMESVLKDGLQLFEKIWGYKSSYFVATNGPFNNTLEKILAENEIEYLLAERIQKEPLGGGKYKKHLHYIGMRNIHNQIYLTRNSAFEPTVYYKNPDLLLKNCIQDIERAFRWGKPVTISTHRLNYTGRIEEKNRTVSLKLLNVLLNSILKRWPDVEFMSSVELGGLINQKQ